LDGEVKGLKEGEKDPKYDILNRQLHEAIGSSWTRSISTSTLTDLDGTVYRCGIDGKDKEEDL
jgi:hypothetical protein